MKRLMTLLVALIASTSAGWAQPRLPGPAEQGWYVLIGNSPISRDMMKGGFPWPACKAMIVAADYRVDIRPALQIDTTSGPHVLPDFPVEPKRFGPFNSQFDAAAALIRSGWNVNRPSDSVIFGESGCDMKLVAEQRQLAKEVAEAAERQRKMEEAERRRQREAVLQQQREQEAANAAARQQPRRQAAAAPNAAAVLTASEMEGVRNKIRPCWNTIGGGRDQNMIITLVIQMNKDGTPAKAELKDTERYNNDPNYRAAADAAHRAIMNPRCGQWPLSPAKYESWRYITFNLDPRDY